MAPCLGSIARGAKRNKHTRVVSILDNVIPHEKRPGDKALIRFFLNSVDGFVAMSKSVSEDLLSLKPSAFFIMNPHPLYDNFGDIIASVEARRLLNLSNDYRYILFFGFIRDYKGLDLLLDAMNTDKVRALNIKLIVAGEFYTDPAPYLEQIDRYGLSNDIIMATDFIPDEKVGAYFSACDLVVQPYKSATQSGVTQIAYHFEKPMVVTDVGGLAEIVPHGKAGYVVQPEPNAIAEAIQDFFAKAGSDSFTAGIKEEKKKYSWPQMVNSIEMLYQKITNSKPC
jgi:glycosyltransferase involved in cell wall biosynthesis